MELFPVVLAAAVAGAIWAATRGSRRGLISGAALRRTKGMSQPGAKPGGPRGTAGPAKRK
jgi:hypothetical protein